MTVNAVCPFEFWQFPFFEQIDFKFALGFIYWIFFFQISEDIRIYLV